MGGTVAARYTYDPLDRRIGIQDNGIQTWVVWDGPQPYADFNGAGALQERYLYGPAVDEILARTDSVGTTSWYLTDRAGSIRNLADSSGTVTGTISYDGFGKVLSSSGAVDRFGYTGREYDPTTGLQSNRERYYDAALGRWTQEDKSGFAGEDANLERYVGNSPTNASDPSGLEGEWFNNDWTDWYNPFAYIGAAGYASGDLLGAGLGRWAYGNPGIALDVSRLRQERLVRELSDPGSSLSTSDAARERLGALSNGLNEAGSYAADIGNGAVAAVELAWDVASIVNVGVSLRGAAGALQRRPRGPACPPSNAPNSSILTHIPTSGRKFNQIARRGWTREGIHQTVNNPFTTRPAINKGTGNPATAFFNQDGSHVIRDNITRELVQLSDRMNPGSWIPDPVIVNPYRP